MKALAKRIREEFEAIDRIEERGGPRSPTFKAIFALLSCAVILTVMHFVVLSWKFQELVSQGLRDLVGLLPEGALKDLLLFFSPLYRHVAWSLGCVTLYFALPALAVRLCFREPLRAYGISPKGFLRHLPTYIALFLPVLFAVFLASFTEAFQATYPFYHDPQGLLDLTAWEFFYCLQFFALEFFFRGYLLHAMKARLGLMSVFAMVVPYCMIHFQKPMAEAFAAIIAGTVLGLLSLRTNTIWGGVAIHCAVAVSMDLASLFQRGFSLF